MTIADGIQSVAITDNTLFSGIIILLACEFYLQCFLFFFFFLPSGPIIIILNYLFTPLCPVTDHIVINKFFKVYTRARAHTHAHVRRSETFVIKTVIGNYI
jgi:hypothetical protein